MASTRESTEGQQCVRDCAGVNGTRCVKRAIQRRRQAWTAWKNSESSSCGVAYHHLQQEQRRSRRILRAELLSLEWKLANSAKTAHVNRSKRLTACIPQLRHPSGSLINSDQEMAELLKTTFLGFLHEDEGSTLVLQTRTQTCMADPLITEREFWRTLNGLNPHKGAGPDGLSLRSSKSLTPTLSPYLPECLLFHSNLSRSPKICAAQ